jgi:hypothetical protein
VEETNMIENQNHRMRACASQCYAPDLQEAVLIDVMVHTNINIACKTLKRGYVTGVYG